MTSFFGSGPLPDWKEMRDWLGGDIPWHLVDKWDRLQDADWLDRLVNKFVQEGGQSFAQSAKPNFRYDIVPKAKQLMVTVELPPGTRPHHVRLYADSRRLRLDGLPEGKSQFVPFPCRVYPKTGKSKWTDRKLLVEFRRNRAIEEEVELFIRP